MTKIAIIGDTHFGTHGNSDIFLKSQLKFFRKEFIPYLKKHNITRIFHLGDFWDNRSNINVRLKNIVYDLFENELKDFKITILVGNHDSYYRNNIETHSLKFFKKFDNVDVVEDIKLLSIKDRKILLAPWQPDLNEFKNRVANNNIFCDILFGHFPIIGFRLNNKKVNEHGIDSDVFFDNYKHVFSGHFHSRSSQSRADRTIEYIGNPYQLTFSDCGDDRGFCVLDLDDLNYEYINNTKSLEFKSISYPEPITRSDIKGNIVRLEIKHDINFNEEDIEKYISTIESYKPALPITINRITDIESAREEYKSIDFLELINEYLGEIEMDRKEDVYNRIEELYQKTHTDKEICV